MNKLPITFILIFFVVIFSANPSIAGDIYDEVIEQNNYSKGNYDRAIEDWEAVLRIDPNHATARKILEAARQEKAKTRR